MIFLAKQSIPDEIMMKWFDLLSLRPLEEIKKLRRYNGGANTRDAKIDLAMELTSRFTSEKEAEKAKIISLKNSQAMNCLATLKRNKLVILMCLHSKF